MLVFHADNILLITHSIYKIVWIKYNFLWNASFSRQFLKNNKGELKFSVFDILKQNRSVSRNYTDNYVEDVQNTVLRRFFMLTFTYNLNKMGGRNMPMQGRGTNRSFRVLP